jgi:hypothetical protein
MVALAVALAACGSSESGGSDSGSATAGSSGTTTSDGTADKSTGGGSDGPKKLKIGDEITLKGLNDATLRVKVLGIIDPLIADNEIPKPGRRFVGVKVRFQNLAKKAYRDAPLNGSIVLTNVKKGANPTILLGSECPSKMGTRLRMKAGATLNGCLPFQVKKKAKVTGFKFALNSGFGPETAEWSVK